MSEPRRPLLDFMVIGAQKCGTVALHRFLSRHPEIGMSVPKEVHLFDAPGYSRAWTPAQIDERYRPHFEHCAGASIRGESTPLYLFFPDIAPELHRYNPELKLIVLLRDPVERAISHYYWERRTREVEHRPLWRALLSEPRRLRRCHDPRAPDSAMRVASYRTRGLYSLQLRNLYRFFDPERVLIVGNRELRECHDAVLRRAFAFLGVSEEVRIAPGVHNQGRRGARRHRVVSWLLRLSYRREHARLRALSPAAARCTAQRGTGPGA